MIPIGVNLTSMGVPSSWWLDTARLLEVAGFRGVWCWDHFISRGSLTDPVLECWTTLTATAARTDRLRVGSFVSNVMNRHPALLAKISATLHDQSHGRVELGIGIGGHPREHEAYGMDYPPAPERVARLEESVEIVRRLWAGGPADFEGRHYHLKGAYAHPVPMPPPRIIVGGEKPGGARLAARVGDAWTMQGEDFDELEPIFREALEAAGRSRADVSILVSVNLEQGVLPSRQPLFRDLAAVASEWERRGVDELIVHWVRPRDVVWLLAAADRAGLTRRGAGPLPRYDSIVP